MSGSKGSKGFSLIELIVTVTVLAVISSMVIGLMHQMSNTSAQQRRSQAERINEEQARMALLNIVRDARLSHSATVSGNQLVLTSFHVRRGQNVTITYTWDNNPASDVYTGNLLLQRTSVSAPGGIQIGDGPEDWPNTFSPIALDGVTATIDSLNRLNIELVMNVPDGMGGEDIWNINSAVSMQRMP